MHLQGDGKGRWESPSNLAVSEWWRSEGKGHWLLRGGTPAHKAKGSLSQRLGVGASSAGVVGVVIVAPRQQSLPEINPTTPTHHPVFTPVINIALTIAAVISDILSFKRQSFPTTPPPTLNFPFGLVLQMAASYTWHGTKCSSILVCARYEDFGVSHSSFAPTSPHQN